MEHDDTREMILAAALALGCKAADTCGELNMLAVTLSELVDVGDTQWHLTGVFQKDPESLRLIGHAHGELPSVLAEVLFGGSSGFDFQLPLVWARRAHLSVGPA